MNILVKTKIIFKTSYFLQDIVRRALICLYVVITYSLKFDNFFSLQRGLKCLTVCEAESWGSGSNIWCKLLTVSWCSRWHLWWECTCEPWGSHGGKTNTYTWTVHHSVSTHTLRNLHNLESATSQQEEHKSFLNGVCKGLNAFPTGPHLCMV